MNNTLTNVRRTLHDLLRQLPAMRTHGTPDAIRRHVALIAHFQQQYDRLIAATRMN